jgi:hypothetical protein
VRCPSRRIVPRSASLRLLRFDLSVSMKRHEEAERMVTRRTDRSRTGHTNMAVWGVVANRPLGWMAGADPKQRSPSPIVSAASQDRQNSRSVSLKSLGATHSNGAGHVSHRNPLTRETARHTKDAKCRRLGPRAKQPHCARASAAAVRPAAPLPGVSVTDASRGIHPSCRQ